MGIYILDLAKYQPPNTIPWRTFRENGVRMGIVKSSMGGGYDYRCDDHSANIRDGGVDLGLYHWIDPTRSTDQMYYMIDKINLHGPEAIGYDIEQWWSSWDLWYEYINGQRPASEVPRISSQQWIDTLGGCREIIRSETDYELNARALSYSARWVLNLYPQLIPHLSDLPQWIAYYVLSGSPRRVTWDQLHTLPPTGTQPGLPEGIVDHLLWQFTSLLILPGVNFNMDTNKFNGTEEQYEAWVSNDAGGPEPPGNPVPVTRWDCLIDAIKLIIEDPSTWLDVLRYLLDCLLTTGQDPEPEPDPEPAPLYYGVVFASALTVRSGPGVSFGPVRYLENGDRVPVWEIEGNWGRISPGGNEWISLSWINQEA